MFTYTFLWNMNVQSSITFSKMKNMNHLYPSIISNARNSAQSTCRKTHCLKCAIDHSCHCFISSPALADQARVWAAFCCYCQPRFKTNLLAGACGPESTWRFCRNEHTVSSILMSAPAPKTVKTWVKQPVCLDTEPQLHSLGTAKCCVEPHHSQSFIQVFIRESKPFVGHGILESGLTFLSSPHPACRYSREPCELSPVPFPKRAWFLPGP